MMLFQRLLGRIRRSLSGLYERLLFRCARKRDNYVFFYPHPNGRVDGYDVINYHSDNVLCLINYIVTHKEYNHLRIFIVVFDLSKLGLYHDYIKQLNPNQAVFFIYEDDRTAVIKHAAKSKFIFTDTGHTYFRYKSKQQKLVCLNYFVPFKNDYIPDKPSRESRAVINNLFDYFLMTAPLPARVSACDKGIPLSNFLILGFCRNDVFYREPSDIIKNYISKVIDLPVSKIIVYTPTYRDYEAAKADITRDVFGYDGSEYDEMEKVLEEHNAVLVAKLHPKQTNIKVNSTGESRIVMYSELCDNPFSLYEFLAEADGLITDYTSTYFDFLHRNKPVIFNFYDFDLYTKTRGFGFEPIKIFCAGDIVSDANSLVDSVSRVLHGIDANKEKREMIAPVFDSFYDGGNTERICDFFFRVY